MRWFLHYARDTHCLFDCPWRHFCLFCVFQTFCVLCLVLAPGTKTVFTAFNIYSMLPAMPPQYPLPEGYVPYGQQQQEPHGPWDREEGLWDYRMKTKEGFKDWSGSPE